MQLDGFVARKMGINSVIGSYLDPLADKVRTAIFRPFVLTIITKLNFQLLLLVHCVLIVILFIYFQVLIGCVAVTMVKMDLLHRKYC